MACPGSRLPKFFLREDKRVAVYGGLPSPELLVENKWTEKASACGALAYSADGYLMASSSASNVVLFDVDRWKQRLCLSENEVTNLYFSPKATVLCTYKPHSVLAVENLKLWNVKTGELLASFVEQNRDNWHPMWSDDESVAIRMAGSEIHVFLVNAFGAPAHKTSFPRMRDVALSPGPSPLHICLYNTAQGTGMASASLYRCGLSSVDAMVTNKVFTADRVNFYWNRRGKAVVVMAITDVDPENKSYYGRESLHLLKTDGEACLVVFGKVGGPVHAVEWHPDSKHFCVVHGSMPATATLFNLKADPVFTFPPAPRNDVHFNSFGNLVCLCGFGSVSGNMEFWCMKTRRLVSHVEADQTTFVQWCPDGAHFLTATTAPRLRVNNGFKVWHYTGELVCQERLAEGTQLLQIGWSPEGSGRYAEPTVDMQKIASAKPNVIPKPQAYVPPHLRGRNADGVPGSTPMIDLKQATEMAKKKKKERKKTKVAGSSSSEAGKADRPEEAVQGPTGVAAAVLEKMEREKRMLVISRKLRQIAQLKEKVEAGYQMQANQVTKLAAEDDLLAELEMLKNATN